MKAIDINSLSPGYITEKAFYTAKGELLIGANVTLSKQHLDTLLRRNIFKVYIEDGKSELKKLLDKNFEDIDKLLLKKNKPGAGSLIPQIAPGEIGFSTLLNDQIFSEVDAITGSGQFDDRPEGVGIKSGMKQNYLADRPQEYKAQVNLTYSKALKQVEWILGKLINAEKVDGGRIRWIVELFLKTFLNDRNIILAISFRKSVKQEYIFSHTLNVCLLAISIAAEYGYSEEQVIQIGIGAILHDLGMLLVPSDIRFKKGRLSSDEWFEVRKHPLLGLYLMEKLVKFPESVRFILYQSHERNNGKGYPKQRTAKFIHNYAKIIQIADVYEAISSSRPYRDALLPYSCIEFLIKMNDKGFINNDLLKNLISCISLFPLGSLIQLSDGRVARVVFINKTRLDRPTVSVLRDNSGKNLEPERIYQLDLSREENLKVVQSLPFDSPDMDFLHGF